MPAALQELSITDLGGSALDPAELYTDDLIAWVDNMNTDLGTENDPHFGEYKAFFDEIKSAKIITLDADMVQPTTKFDEMDLSGENEPTPDLAKDYFMVFMNAIIFNSIGATPYDLKAGDEFAPFTDRGLAPWDDITVPV